MSATKSLSFTETESPVTTSGANGGLSLPDFRKIGTRDFWLGNYNYAALIIANPFNPSTEIPFFAPNEKLPVALALLLGLQHSLAMVGGIITPPILLGGGAGAALSAADQQYLISACLIWCALGTCLQVSRISLGKGYFLGTGVLNVVGTSFAFVSTGLTFINNQYKADGSGMCQLAADGSKLPCPEVYGALLGTASVVSILAIAMAFVPARILKKMFPPLITGSVLLLIGITLVTSGINNWAGGAGTCKYDLTVPCVHGETWGSASLVGLGFSVFVSIVLLDLLGPPLVKNCAVFIGLLVGIIIAAACGYFDKETIRNAPAATFIWTTRFPLSIKGELILPFIAAYFVIISETVGNITATVDVSRLPLEGAEFSSRIQGGLLADTLFACVAGLATVPPTTTFSQNIGVVALTRNASRISGYTCAFFLFLMGIFSKFGAVFVAMPVSVAGGMTTFLFSSVAIAGIRILAYCPWTRRTRFIATTSLSLGFAAIVVPNWFSYVFTYSGSNTRLQGFLSAITLIVEESYLITMIIAIPLNLIVPYGSDDREYQKANLPVDIEQTGEVHAAYEGKAGDV